MTCARPSGARLAPGVLEKKKDPGWECVSARPSGCERKMKSGLTTRIITQLLVIATIALVGAAVVNYHQRHSFALPDDGAQWIDAEGGPRAVEVTPGGPADRAGIQPGDELRGISGLSTQDRVDIARALDGVGIWGRASYELVRGGVAFQAELIVEPLGLQQPPLYYFQWLLAGAYLTIGAFVFARRTARPMVRHFYVFCLASFVLYAFSYSGELQGLDRFIYWGDVWATLLVPAIFLHFCLVFPRARLVSASRIRAAKWAYAPIAGLLALHHLVASGAVDTGWPLVDMREILDRVEYALLGLYFLAGAAVLRFGPAAEAARENVVLRQQRKWLAQGTLAGVAPFVALYVVPFAAGWTIGPNQSLVVFTLALIPLTFAYAIVRFRLMDVDVILRRGAAYTLATTTLLTAFYGLVMPLDGLLQGQPWRELSPAVWVVSVIVAALLFQPLRNRIQAKLEQRFYQDRYDYRRTLVDFASELSTETDLDRAIAALGDRLVKTLGVSRLAVFSSANANEDGRLRLLRGLGLTDAHGAAIEAGSPIDLRFLAPDPEQTGGKPYYFLEDPRDAADLEDADRQAVLDLDLNYYVPCRVKGRAIAYLGLGRTTAGDYLSSEDLSLVLTVSGYFAIALENARLVSSLEEQLAENERLKDYNQNIVESLNVGVLALDLEGRVESWNTQLELTFGISRGQAVGRSLGELLPADLVVELDRIEGESGIRNIYKFPLRADAFPEPFRPAPSSVKVKSGNGTYGVNGLDPRDIEQRMLNVAAAPLVTKNFDPIGRLIIFDDVTERVELEEQLVQADKLSSIGLLAAGVAHEVNTPLAVISSYAQMLAKRVADDPGQAKMLEKITSQTFRASEIVNSLLNVSRTSPREFTQIDLNRTVQETLALLEPQLRKARIEVETHLDPEAAAVIGNSGRLQQVLLNLFLNARDAMPQGGKLVVSNEVREVADEAVAAITVQDTGSGIDTAHLKHVFDPFFTTKGNHRGTGLGLAVSYGIVREHSGTMGVESEAGQGTSFSIELPLARKPIHA